MAIAPKTTKNLAQCIILLFLIPAVSGASETPDQASSPAAANAAGADPEAAQPGPERAQAAREPESDNDSPDSRQLERLTVTVRKQTEPQMRVPASTTVITRDDLFQGGIADIRDIAQVTPGMNYVPIFGSGFGHPVMRGLSQTIGESNVSFFLDGVYQSSRAALDALLFDIERVEVIRGPQNALYGRNSFGGAVNFITRDPAREWTGGLEASLGEFGLREFRASASGPLSGDDFFIRAGAFHHEQDGFFQNELTGRPLDNNRSDFAALSIEGFPADPLQVRTRVSIEDTDNGDDPLQFVPNNFALFDPTFSGLPEVPQMFRGTLPAPDEFAFTPGSFERESINSSLTVKYHQPDWVLTSLTGYNRIEIHHQEDADYRPQRIRELDRLKDRDEISQEVRVSSPPGAPIGWIAGYFYYDLDASTFSDDRFVGSAAEFPGGLVSDVNEATESHAVFGKVDYPLTDKWELSASARLTHEEKSVRSLDQDPVTDASPKLFEDEATFDLFTPRLALQYQHSDDHLGYASVTRAAKSGGFNVLTVAGAIQPDERTYDEETSLNYEIGYRGWFLEDRLYTNLALFHIKWKDQIVRALGESGAVLNSNAAESTSQGFELEWRARPATGFDLNGSLSYVDAAYDDYFFGALAGLGMEPDLSGVAIEFVPKWTAHLGLRYQRPAFSNLDWNASFDVSWQDEMPVVQTTDAYIDDKVLGKLRIGLAADQWDLSLWIRNLFNEDDPAGNGFVPDPGLRADFHRGLAGQGPVTGFTAFSPLVEARDPRQAGLTFRRRF
jgi:iron complex outermembrane receptor protein